MSLAAITDTNYSLVRDRILALNLYNCNVYVAKGSLASGDDSWDLLSDFTTFLADFKNIGVNQKDSPDLTSEDIIEEVDYMPRTIGQKISGTIAIKLINADLITLLNSSEMQNQELTFVFVPKSYNEGDIVAIFSGLNITKKIAVKGNTEATPMVELAVSGIFSKNASLPNVKKVPYSTAFELDVAQTDVTGDYVYLTFTKNVSSKTVLQIDDFEVAIDGVRTNNVSIQMDSGDIHLRIEDTIANGEIVTVSYSKQSSGREVIYSTDGDILESFTDESVTNNVPA